MTVCDIIGFNIHIIDVSRCDSEVDVGYISIEVVVACVEDPYVFILSSKEVRNIEVSCTVFINFCNIVLIDSANRDCDYDVACSVRIYSNVDYLIAPEGNVCCICTYCGILLEYCEVGLVQRISVVLIFHIYCSH